MNKNQKSENIKDKNHEGAGCSYDDKTNDYWSKKEEKVMWENHYAYQAPEVRGRLQHVFGCSNMYTEINQPQNDLRLNIIFYGLGSLK